MSNEIEQGLHEKLCAFILGEASEEVRAEVERELAKSPELRAERERIEGTIGLVKGAMAGNESLSRPAGVILAQARTPRRRPWFAPPALPIAASVAAAALVGVLGYRAMDEAGDHEVAPAQVAQLGRPMTERSPGLEKAQRVSEEPAKESELLAFAEKRAEVGSLGVAEPPASSPVVVDGKAEESPRFAATGVGIEGQRASVTVETLDRLDSIESGARGLDSNHLDLNFKQDGQSRRLKELGYTDSTAPISPLPEDSFFRASSADASPSTPFAGRKLAPVGTAKGGGAARVPSSSMPNSMNKTLPSDTNFYSWRDGALGISDAKDERSALGEERRAGLAGMGYAGADEDDGVGRDLSLFDQVRQLSREERERWIDSECTRIVARCRRFPNERPRDMFFRFWGDNSFELAALDPFSTFSVDVDTASYTLARRYLNEGHIPRKAQIRTEEFVNYFKADVPAPTETTFAIHTDLTPSRFSSDKARSMLRVVVRGKEVAKEERKPLNITFVVDTSGSMKENGRLELVKHAMRLLVNELDPRDAIAIVAFSNDARLILPMTSAGRKAVIESAIFPMVPDGSTNAAAGLLMGYSEALTKINANAMNRVLLLSDGVANTGETDQERITEAARLHREKGIYLNTIGVGMNNHNDTLLEQLADKGDGICSYVDGPDEARKAIVDRFTGAFETIARDVKIQVEFDPAQVERYRLLGYENRAIADQDFRNDKIDAGEVGAGHQVTALYEIERAANASEKPFATVRVRWKAPRNVAAPTANEEANEIAKPVSVAQQTSFEGAGVGYRRAVVVAQFAEFLRRSVHARGDSLENLIVEAERLEKETRDTEVLELVALMRKSKQLILNALPGCDELCQTIDAVRRNAILRCQEEFLVEAQVSEAKLQWLRGLGYIGESAAERLDRENAELEKRIKEILRNRLEGNPK